MKTKTSQFQALKNLEQLTHFLIRIGSISLFVLMSVALNAQSATWTGLFTDDWNFPFNWSPMMVPTATTDVYINSASNNPVIKSGTNAFTKSITVNTGGNLTLATNSTLKVSGSTSSGIFNNGTIENNGDIRIDGSAHDGILNNGGTFTNKYIIRIGVSQKPGFAAIHNKANQTFENQHYIEIVKATLEGVKNEGIIKNAGDFVIGNDNLGDIGEHGLLNWNGGSFTNEQGGQLFLTNLPKAGIINIFSSQFTNKGNLKVGTGSAVGLWGIANDVSSTFDNEANASISVDYTSLTAILNSNSSNFNNKGIINIGYSNKVKKGIDQFSGTFTNEAGGSINIAETDEEGITIDAIFNNYSSIYIGGFKKVGTTGINNATYGTFNNLTGGDIQIDETGSYGIENLGAFNNKANINLGEQKKVAFAGILNKSSGVFTNDTGGNLEIDETGGYGIENIDQATFINKANLKIGQNKLTWVGIDNTVSASFINEAAGDIQIDETSSDGISNNGTLTNKGKLTLGANKKIGRLGIYNFGTINNDAGADLKVEETDSDGINNSSGAVFNNSGKLNIGINKSTGFYGFSNSGLLNNNGGEITIEKVAGQGLDNRGSSATINNNGKLVMSKSNPNGNAFLVNVQSAAFTNGVCGDILLFNSLFNVASATITNNGFIHTNTSKSLSNQSTIINNGIINSVGSFLFVNTNNEIIIRKKTATDCMLSPAFDLGNPVDFTINGVYSDMNATVSAGTYVQGTNTFTPLSAFAPTNKFYVKVTDSNGGCTRIAEWDVDFTGDNTNPIANCKATYSVTLVNNNAVITGNDIDNGSSDNCGIVSYDLDKSTFDCNDLGNSPVTVTLTVKDAAGNEDTCTSSVSVTATTSTSTSWTGSASDDWSNPCNWNNGVPGSITDVYINSASTDPVIKGSTNAFAKSITVNTGGNLTLAANSTLKVSGSTSSGIFNNGTIENNGDIRIDGSAHDGILNNGGTFTNKYIIRIGVSQKPGFAAIHNKANQTFENQHYIEIVKATLQGVKNEGIIKNTGDFVIGNDNLGDIGEHGLLNTNGGTFTNENGGQLFLTNLPKSGIVNIFSSQFINKGNLKVGTGSAIGFNGIANDVSSTFDNESTGSISVDFTTFTAISNSNSAAFNNKGTINIGYSNKVKKGIDQFSGTFTNEAGASINIAETDEVGITNDAIFNNHSSILIGWFKKVGTTGIKNATYGTFNNLSGGDVQIDETGSYGIENLGAFNNKATINLGEQKKVAFAGILNKSAGNFTNDTGGNLEIDETGGYGIENIDQATFINKANLKIGQNKLTWVGIDNTVSASFINEAAGDIQIDETSSDGISNNGTLTNKGKLTLGANKKIGRLGIYNFGTFNNQSGSSLQIEETNSSGINNSSSGIFNNTGKLDIGKNKLVGSIGFDNSGIINNNTGGEITIEKASSWGIDNRGSSAIINNNGKLIMGQANPNDNTPLINISNATFTNGTCGEFMLYNGLFNQLSAIITNNGFIYTNTTKSLSNQSTVINNGMINNIGSFLFVNTNNEIIVRKDQAKECIMVPALELGNPVDFTVDGIFTDANATISAGTFVQATNTFNPSTPFAATNTYFVKITDTNGGCTRIAEWEVTYMGDVTNPVANCKSTHAVQLDANGNASIVATDIDDNSTDGCGIDTYTVNINTFDCSDVINSPVTVTLTVKDEAGNQNTCTTPVTVEDNLPPVVTCKDITVSLNGSGNVTITGIQIYQSGSDNCGIASFSASPNSFDCSNIGTNTVTLTATGYGGDVGTCTSVVTVKDNLAPVAVCKNHTVLLDTNGNGSLSPNDIDGGSTDNCAIQNMTINQTNFDCSDIGTHTVTLNLSDTNGNNSSCNATVTVSDNVVPVAVCKDLTISCGGGQVTIFPSDVDDGSTDNCGTPTLSLDQNVLACTNTPTTVTLTATDAAGNTDNCQATITFQVQQGSISLSINDVEKNEGNFWGITIFTFTVTRSGGTSPVSVNYSTADGSATTADLDYNFLSGTLNWSNGGSNTKTINVVVRRDNKFEPDENFFVNLSNPTGAVISDGQGEGIILNDAAAPTTINPNEGNQSIQSQHFVAEDLELNVYPNPVRTVMNIELSAHPSSDSLTNSQLKMVDLNGRTIWLHTVQNQENFIQVPTGDWSRGAYILYWINDQTIKTQKVIIE